MKKSRVRAETMDNDVQKFSPLEMIIRELEQQKERLSRLEQRQVPAKERKRTPMPFSVHQEMINQLREQGKKISDMEERLKERLGIPSNPPPLPQTQTWTRTYMQEFPLSLERPLLEGFHHDEFGRPVYYDPDKGWVVDPICIVCGAEYWAESHEHGLCPKCSKEYRWLR